MTEDEIILTHILQCRSVDLAFNKPKLTDLQQEQFESYKQRRYSGEPLQYILGTCNFMGVELAVNPSVLVPRPETEQLVDTALKYFKGGAILDLGCGSGNISIALAKHVPQAQITSIDISADALDLARANALQHGVEGRITFIQADILGSLTSLEHASSFHSGIRKDAKFFDLIISNPPYIPTDQLSKLPVDVQKEPVAALDGGEDGLKFCRIIIKYTHFLLRRGACLMMEFGDGQADAIKKLVEAELAFFNLEIFKDLAGRERFLKVIKR